MLTFETISLDCIFKKQSWYLCRISPERPGHEMLLARGKISYLCSMVKDGSSVKSSLHIEVGDRMSLSTAANSVLGCLLPFPVAWEQRPRALPVRPCRCGGAPWFRVSGSLASRAWETHGGDQQFHTTLDNSPLNSLKKGYVKVSEVEFSFHLGVKEYSWKDVVKEEGTWKQNGEGFIWAQHSEPKLFVHKILSSLYSKVFLFPLSDDI